MYAVRHVIPPVTCCSAFSLEKKEKSFFSVIFQFFFKFFFFKVDVEVWGRSIHDGSARSEQRNMPFGKSFFLKKIIFFAYFF